MPSLDELNQAWRGVAGTMLGGDRVTVPPTPHPGETPAVRSDMVPEPNPPSPLRRNPTTENIEAMGTTNVPQAPSNIHVLTIVGQVEGHLTLPPQNKTTKYEHIIPQLVAAEQSTTVEGVLVVLNTVGGDVEAGLAIAEMIASMSKPSVSLVLGGGHSIGVTIAVACTHSFIASTATMTIHPIRLTGLVIGVPMLTEGHRLRTGLNSSSGSRSPLRWRMRGCARPPVTAGPGFSSGKRRRASRLAS